MKTIGVILFKVVIFISTSCWLDLPQLKWPDSIGLFGIYELTGAGPPVTSIISQLIIYVKETIMFMCE